MVLFGKSSMSNPQFPKILTATIPYDDNLSLNAFGFLMGQVFTLYLYLDSPKIGSIVINVRDEFKTPPSILFEGQNFEAALSISQVLAEKIQKAVFASVNSSKPISHEHISAITDAISKQYHSENQNLKLRSG